MATNRFWSGAGATYAWDEANAGVFLNWFTDDTYLTPYGDSDPPVAGDNIFFLDLAATAAPTTGPAATTLFNQIAAHGVGVAVDMSFLGGTQTVTDYYFIEIGVLSYTGPNIVLAASGAFTSILGVTFTASTVIATNAAADQLVIDVAAVTAESDKIIVGTTILGVAGTAASGGGGMLIL
jgi:hypothetical protein